MIKPFMLAQVALKSYAVAFILLLLMPPPLIVPFTVFNVAVSTIIIGVVIGLLTISKGLSKHRVWAHILAYITFIGIAAITTLVFIRSIEDKKYDGHFWIQLWLLTMSTLGLVSLLCEQLNKGENN
jgi:energy-converting hydrogenase Eha subunit E